VNKKFFPRGAIASFVVMIVLFVAIWFTLYFVAIARS